MIIRNDLNRTRYDCPNCGYYAYASGQSWCGECGAKMGKEIASWKINGDDKSKLTEFFENYRIALDKNQYEELFKVVNEIAVEAYRASKRKK